MIDNAVCGHTHPGTGYNVKLPSEGDLYIRKI